MSTPADKLKSILNGRELPSRVALRLDDAIAAEDPRVLDVLNATEDPDIRNIVRPILADMRSDWDACFEGCTLHQAKQLSSNVDRDKVLENLSATNLTYGEVNFESLSLALCRHVEMRDKKVFYDVGSGSGRGCFTAALIHDFEKIGGIEVIPGLHEAAVTQHQHYEAKVLPRLEVTTEKYLY